MVLCAERRSGNPWYPYPKRHKVPSFGSSPGECILQSFPGAKSRIKNSTHPVSPVARVIAISLTVEVVHGCKSPLKQVPILHFAVVEVDRQKRGRGARKAGGSRSLFVGGAESNSHGPAKL